MNTTLTYANIITNHDDIFAQFQAFAMASHPRLGEDSPAKILLPELKPILLDYLVPFAEDKHLHNHIMKLLGNESTTDMNNLLELD
jgi:hypothetical protein